MYVLLQILFKMAYYNKQIYIFKFEIKIKCIHFKRVCILNVFLI